MWSVLLRQKVERKDQWAQLNPRVRFVGDADETQDIPNRGSMQLEGRGIPCTRMDVSGVSLGST